MSERGKLERRIGVKTATAIVVGEVIAVGIFLTPAGMAKTLGSPALVLAVWLAVGALTLCGALCYGELAARFPEAGGGYVYLREAYGAPAAFLYGWTALLVIDPGITAALAAGLAGYAAYSFGLTNGGAKAVAIVTILLLAVVNIRGVRFGAWLVRWLTVVKLGLLFFVVLWGFGLGLGEWSNFAPFAERRAGSAPLVPALASALASAFFSFAGWWDVSKLAGEVRHPARTLPRALSLGVVVVTLVYVLVSFAFIYLVPTEQVTSAETFAAQAGEALFGTVGGQAFSGVVIVAVLGSLAGIIMSAPRVYFAMARDGLFFPSVARVHTRFGTPARAITIQAALASVLVLTGTFDQIVSYFIFVVLIFIALTVAALFRLRRVSSDRIAYLTPGYPVTPLLFLSLILVLLVMIAANTPDRAGVGVAVVAAGLPIYLLLFRARRTRAAED